MFEKMLAALGKNNGGPQGLLAAWAKGDLPKLVSVDDKDPSQRVLLLDNRNNAWLPKIEAMLTHESAPAEMPTPPEWKKKIMHGRITIDGEVLMASDAPPDRSDGGMKGFSVTLGTDTPAEAERIFHALAENGTVRMPIQETFWAARFGMLVDQFGTPWMINCDKAG